MALQSDFTIDASKFRPEAVGNEVRKLNEYLMDTMKKGSKRFEVGAAKYREMRARGETVFPQAVVLDRGRNFSIPSREGEREIPCPVMTHENGIEAKAVFMHIHGGGFVVSSEKETDTVLAKIADLANVVVVSVGHRLAPESRFPAELEMRLICSSWAESHLVMSTYLQLTASRPSFKFSGLIPNYGIFDLSFFPQVHIFKKRANLILDQELMEHYRNAFCPDMSLEQLQK
ncbi:MAG: hypothetical protein L6R42_004991 [Xanthoria sp. 1 TBL-2021]|nr:MAG: hypothetical protein L6R42_004991 [Xanthoria sp. 1 TBL-2021]